MGMNMKHMSWWDRLIQGGQHTAFRLLSVVFSAASAWAIYWFFTALGDEPIQHLFTVLTSVGFVALGYFVTRGLAHRMMNKRRVRSYIPLAVLYIIVEVSCNFAHAAAKYPDVVWIHQLRGWQLAFFSLDLPLVLSIIPLFNLALAALDVDLMQERGVVPPQPVWGGLKPSNGNGNGGYASGLAPQGAYPVVPAPNGNGRPNALKSWWGARSSSASSNGAGTGAGIP